MIFSRIKISNVWLNLIKWINIHTSILTLFNFKSDWLLQTCYEIDFFTLIILIHDAFENNLEIKHRFIRYLKEHWWLGFGEQYSCNYNTKKFSSQKHINEMIETFLVASGIYVCVLFYSFFFIRISVCRQIFESWLSLFLGHLQNDWKYSFLFSKEN